MLLSFGLTSFIVFAAVEVAIFRVVSRYRNILFSFAFFLFSFSFSTQAPVLRSRHAGACGVQASFQTRMDGKPHRIFARVPPRVSTVARNRRSVFATKLLLPALVQKTRVRRVSKASLHSAEPVTASTTTTEVRISSSTGSVLYLSNAHICLNMQINTC